MRPGRPSASLPQARAAELAGGVQRVTVTVRGGYSPDVIRARRGVPLEVTFDRQESGDCTSRVVFPDLAVSAALPAFGRTTVRLDPATAGEYGFACGMNMIHGTLIVDPDGASGASGGDGPGPAACASCAPSAGAGPSASEAQAAEAEAAEAAERRAEIADLARQVIVGTVLTLPVLFAVMAHDRFKASWVPGLLLNHCAVLVGSARLLSGAGIDTSTLDPAAAELSAQGKTPVLASVDGVPAGVLAVADPVKEDSAAAIAALHRLGVEVVMLTGDNAKTAATIARQVGVRRVLAEVLPEHKAAEITRLQAGGAVVGMTGGGINDAPALAAADVGLAIGTGTDVAIEAADITLISGSLAGVVTAIGLSRATMRNIWQNLFFALAYNGTGIPIAAGLLYPFFGIRLSPVIAAAMALSSLSVVTNANRLRRYRPAPLPEAEAASVEPQVHVGAGPGDAAARHDGAGHGHSAGHDGGAGHEHGASAQAGAGHGHGPQASDGPASGTTMVADPVCGSVDPATAPGHRGTPAGTEYFCSAGCAAAFDADPGRYAAAARTAPGAGTS